MIIIVILVVLIVMYQKHNKNYMEQFQKNASLMREKIRTNQIGIPVTL